jgi:acetylornithine deacetylase
MTERVRETVAGAVPGEPFELTLLGESPALMLDAEAVLHRQLCEMVGQRGTESVAFATDAGWLQTLGMRCAIFGPGSIEVAHRPNEFIPVAEFVRGGELLDDIIRRRCLAE